MGWQVTGLDYSPITGPKGNIEFLAEIRPAAPDRVSPDSAAIRALVEKAHRSL